MVNSKTFFSWYYNSAFNDPITILFIAMLAFVIVYLIYWYMNSQNDKKTNTKGHVKDHVKDQKQLIDSQTKWTWLYATNNSNATILFGIILLLGILIIFMGWYSQKPGVNEAIVISKFQDSASPSPSQKYGDDIISIIPTLPNYQISYKDRDKWIKIMENVEGDSGTVVNSADNLAKSKASQQLSTLYGESDFVSSYDNGGNSTTGSKELKAYNGSIVANYATLDSVGKSLTDSLGGVKTDLGFAVISEILGTSTNTGQQTYDNTQDYRTDIPSDVTGVTTPASNSNCNKQGKYTKTGSPLFLQKDFEGVSNIFAPNIYITNPPLDDAGNPIININFTDNSTLGAPVNTQHTVAPIHTPHVTNCN
uniref:Uncharacterized protein n=1 Tax=viral metagenome TaxID=1070528 RepID=A0A6C0HMI5_9ZZZZ